MMYLLEQIRHFFRPSPSCEEINQFLVEYLEGSLPPQTQAHFKAHLSKCPNCLPYFEQYNATMQMTLEDRLVEFPDALVEHTLAFLRKHFDADET